MIQSQPMPEHLGQNRYRLGKGECLQDKWDQNMVIKGPEIVIEEDLGMIDGDYILRYQGGGYVVGVAANSIYEAVKPCRAER